MRGGRRMALALPDMVGEFWEEFEERARLERER